MLRELLAWIKKLSDKLSVHQSVAEVDTDSEVTMALIYLDWSLKVSICVVLSQSLWLSRLLTVFSNCCLKTDCSLVLHILYVLQQT